MRWCEFLVKLTYFIHLIFDRLFDNRAPGIYEYYITLCLLGIQMHRVSWWFFFLNDEMKHFDIPGKFYVNLNSWRITRNEIRRQVRSDCRIIVSVCLAK